jgi:CMP-N-acetylneuraminic acid synthetase
MKRYTAKNIKFFDGRQGIGYSCDVLLNGEKIGRVWDNADGSMINAQWQNPKDKEQHEEAIRVQMKEETFELAMIYLTS